MGDAVRRVQRHLQELSRDHLAGVEERHHAHLGWLQVELQQLCKQIEVDVRVELTRPPRLSFSKALMPETVAVAMAPPVAMTAVGRTDDGEQQPKKQRVENDRVVVAKPSHTVADSTLANVDMGVVETAPPQVVVAAVTTPSVTEQVSESTQIQNLPPIVVLETRIVKKLVKRTRKVMRPKKVVKREKKVKPPRATAASIDVSALKVVELKSELKKRGLKQTGVKAVLAERLKQELVAEDARHRAEASDSDEEVEIEVVEMEEVIEEYDEEIEEEVQVPATEAMDITDDSAEVVSEALPAPTSTEQVAPRTLNFDEADEMREESTQMTIEDTDAPKQRPSSTKDSSVSKIATSAQNSAQPRRDPDGAQTVDEIVRESDVGVDDFSPQGKLSFSSVTSSVLSPRDGLERFGSKPDCPVVAVGSAQASVVKATQLPADLNVGVDEAAQVQAENANEGRSSRSDIHHGAPPPTPLLTRERSDATNVTLAVDATPTHAIPNPRKNGEISSSGSLKDRLQAVKRRFDNQTVPVQLASTKLRVALPSEHSAISKSIDHTVENSRSPGTRPSTSKVVTNRDDKPSKAARNTSDRDQGSISYVEESQPDQSPQRVSFAPDTVDFPTSHSTRPASTSQLEIQLSAAKVKTPDAASNVAPAHERIAQSEPRLNAAKQQLEDEAERKRREQQQNIEREAHRLRMAAKQSAKKRFEEAKASSLFWAKREQLKMQIQSGPPSADTEGDIRDETARVGASGSTLATDEASHDQPSRSSLTLEVAPKAREPVVISEQPTRKARKSLSLSRATVKVEPTPTSPATQVSDSVKPAHSSRKRTSASAEIDTTSSYPSKRRGSTAKEVEAKSRASKRDSVLATKASVEGRTRRTSTSRFAKEESSISTKESNAPTKDAKTKRASISRLKDGDLVPSRRVSLSRASKLVPTTERESPGHGAQLVHASKRGSLSRDTKPAQGTKRASLNRDTRKTETTKRVSLSRDPRQTQVEKRVSLSNESKQMQGSKRVSLSRDAKKAADAKRASLTSQSKASTTASAKVSSTTASTVPRVSVTAGRSAANAVLSANASKGRESISSTVSTSSNVSTNDNAAKPTTSVMSGGAIRKPTNLVSGLHSFTSLLEKDSANLSSSQGSSTSATSRSAPVVSALKMAEKSRLLEQKKNMEKMKRKEALMKKYEEQRKLDDEKKKKLVQMKEKAEREARQKRELDKTAEKKQRELELTKKRQQRIQEMRAGLEKKRAQIAADKESAASSKAGPNAVPVSRVAAATSLANKALASDSTSAKVSKASKPNLPAGGPKEVTTYEMSENEESSESEGSDDGNDGVRNSKNIPKWAQRDNLERTLRMQFGGNSVDPTPSIFPDFVDTCDLEAIFEPTDIRKKKRFQRRTSSGNWLADRPTAREKAMYKREMGFQR